ncbi:proteinral negative regulator of transcription subunit 5 [Apophysomyces ossiformis]|uniref:General negative regulator of transcription subunit n=1 Tax=Apophysomyces ossiformis TaxID=679940 RepID=A0A8H7BNV1_9FUNG|nr:proteinral negative regulator of transcription subunit 5 [Apophysomyces ossiformis]
MSMKKLQTEIDRVLKKVGEGVDSFEAIFDKIQSATNSNQKEKYEQDLKKEIKKLQRLRDQIKTWLSFNEIKDKSALLENRKLIESQMERFKAIEREMKTKAYSKEGLLQKERLDPKDKEKADACEWISSTVDELSRQMETAEAELETLQGTSRKGKKDHQKVERRNELEHTLERHKWHINRLELILRLLENDHFAADRVMQIKDNVQYFVECNQEPDFEEDEEIYDDLNLEEEEELFNIGTDEHHTPCDADKEREEEEKLVPKRTVKEKEQEKEDDAQTAASTTAGRSSSKASTNTSPKKMHSPSHDDSKASSITSIKAYSNASVAKAPIEAATIPPAGLKYAQAAAAGVASQASQDTNEKLDDKGAEIKHPEPVVQSAWAEPPKIVDQFKSTSYVSDQNKEPPSRPQPQPLQSHTQDSSLGANSVLSSQYSARSSPSTISTLQPSSQPPPDVYEPLLPMSLADLGPSFEAVKSKALNDEDMMYTYQMLDASLQNVPDLIDSERPKVYEPRTPCQTPSYYPQQPLAIFDNPVLFEKFDMDALFFIFYYQQGTYQQYLAARELKKQSWRFHKKYLTWFQRHEEPKIITDDYEQGTYIYFDYEGAWCQRKKTEFRFEYRYLEEA